MFGELDEKLAKSLTGDTTDLLPFLPYLLQDLWELGAMPGDIVALLEAHDAVHEGSKVLDLACGKGAVSIRLAQRFRCKIKGIDLFPEFIATAQAKAEEHGVKDLCEFMAGDIKQAVEHERGYDLVILAAVGDVIGDPLITLQKLRQTIAPGGLILLDDAYSDTVAAAGCYTKAEWLRAIETANLNLLGEMFVDPKELEKVNLYNQAHIVRRAKELMQQYPENADMFERYIDEQQAECDALMEDIVGITWLLQAL